MPKPDLHRARAIAEAANERRQSQARARAREARRERQQAQQLLADLLQAVFERASAGHHWLDASADDVGPIEDRLTGFGFCVDSAETLVERYTRPRSVPVDTADELEQRYLDALKKLGRKLTAIVGMDVAAGLHGPLAPKAELAWRNALEWLDQELVVAHWLTRGGRPEVLPVLSSSRWWGDSVAEADARALRPALVGAVATANALAAVQWASQPGLTDSPLAAEDRRVSWLLPETSSTVLPLLGVSLATLSWVASAAGQEFAADLDLSCKACARTGERSLIVRYGRKPAIGGYPVTGAELDRGYLLPIDLGSFSALLCKWGFTVNTGTTTDSWVDLALSW